MNPPTIASQITEKLHDKAQDIRVEGVSLVHGVALSSIAHEIGLFPNRKAVHAIVRKPLIPNHTTVHTHNFAGAEVLW